MKNEIQKLISELKARSKSHEEEFDFFSPTDSHENFWKGCKVECDFVIDKLELLLKDESKQPQPPISQTPMLGELPPVGNSNIEKSSPAVEGATPVVGQNEQTKELCQCTGVVHISDVDGTWYCLSCKLPVN